MSVAVFDVTVINGELQPKELLRRFEGQQLRISVDVVRPAVESPAAETPPASDEPPEGMDVEKDVYVKMPFRSEIIENAVIVEGGPMQPCLIFPEELPDD